MNRICFFNSIKFWGGGEKLHLENAIEFKKKNYDVSLACHPGSPLWKRAMESDIQTIPVKIGNLSFLNPFKLYKLARTLKKHQIDTIVFSSSQDLKAGSLAAKLAGVKNVVYLRGLAAPVKASLVNRYVFKHCLTHVIANSEETRDQMLKQLKKHVGDEKFTVIYHGIDMDGMQGKNAPRLAEIDRQGRGIILGNAGRLTEQKGQMHLIEMARILKARGLEFTLFIAGTGELEEKLRASIAEHGLEKEVIILGFVAEMESFMNSIDIFVLSSTWEGFGFVIVEAMAKSKPVVAFDITSNPEIVTANETGYLVKYPDIKAFADKVETLISNPATRKEMGAKGLKSVHDRFILLDRVTEIEAHLKATSK